MAKTRFKKIKVAKTDAGKDRIHLEYEQRNGADWDELVFNSADKPAPEFHDALQALIPDVVELCEFPDDYRERMIVKSVSFSYGGEKQVMGATITAQMKLFKSNPPLILNTPHKAEDFYADEGDPKQLLDEATVRKLEVLMIEAEQFIAGKRQQLDAFAGKAA